MNDVLFEILEHNARGQVTREWRAVNAGNPGFNMVRGYNTQRDRLRSLCTRTGAGLGCDVQQCTHSSSQPLPSVSLRVSGFRDSVGWALVRDVPWRMAIACWLDRQDEGRCRKRWGVADD